MTQPQTWQSQSAMAQVQRAGPPKGGEDPPVATRKVAPGESHPRGHGVGLGPTKQASTEFSESGPTR